MASHEPGPQGTPLEARISHQNSELFWILETVNTTGKQNAEEMFGLDASAVDQMGASLS